MEQPGVLVWLSTRRPRVQIPLEALLGPWCNGNMPGSNPVDQGSNPCGPARRHGTQTGKAAKLKPWRSFVGSTPTRVTNMHRLGIGEPKRL